VRHHLLFLGLAHIQPPLTGEGDHAHEHLRIHRCELRVEFVGGELLGQEVLHLRGHVNDEAGEGSRLLGHRRIAAADAEALGAELDVIEEGQTCLLEEESGIRAAECIADGGEQLVHLAIDDDRVEALLATEVLVDDRLGHARLGCDLLDADRLEPLLCEEATADDEELLASLLAGHAHLAAARTTGTACYGTRCPGV